MARFPAEEGATAESPGRPDVVFDYRLASHLHTSVAHVRVFPNRHWLEWAACLRRWNEDEQQQAEDWRRTMRTVSQRRR